MSVSAPVVRGRFESYRLDGEPLKVPGSARIYRLVDRPDLLYKEFAKPLVGAEEIARIEELVSAGAEFGAEGLVSSRGRIAWPRDAVIEQGEILGVTTTYAGDDFCFKVPGSEKTMQRYFTHLRIPETEVEVGVRLRLMRQLAAVLALLEHADLVHGDIAAQNILWRPPPRPSIFLIDCDGMHSDAVVGHGGATEGWTDLRKTEGVIASHDMRSDWFALAIAIWRAMTLSPGNPEHSSGEVILPPATPRPLRSLFVRTFEDVMDADARPSPEEWIRALDEVLGNSRAQRRLDRLVKPSPAPADPPPTPASPPRARSAPIPAPATTPRPAPGPGWPLKRMLLFTAIIACLGVLGATFLDSGPSAGQIHAETAAARWARPRLGGGRVTAECPGDSSLHAGARYRCRVESRGGAVGRVRVKVASGGRASRSLRLFAYRRRAFVRDLGRQYRILHRRGLKPGLKSISCPQTVSANPGTRFQCAVHFTNGANARVAARMRSRSGYYSWRQVGTGVRGLNYARR